MPPHQAKRSEPAEVVEREKLTVIHDGTEYPLYLDEITTRIELELSRETGLTLFEALNPEKWTRPYAATLMWLSQRVRGLRESWDDVASRIGLHEVPTIEILYGEKPDGDDPKAPDTP